MRHELVSDIFPAPSTNAASFWVIRTELEAPPDVRPDQLADRRPFDPVAAPVAFLAGYSEFAID